MDVLLNIIVYNNLSNKQNIVLPTSYWQMSSFFLDIHSVYVYIVFNELCQNYILRRNVTTVLPLPEAVNA